MDVSITLRQLNNKNGDKFKGNFGKTVMVLTRKKHGLISMGTKVEATRIVDEQCFNDADEVKNTFFFVCVFGLPATCDHVLELCVRLLSGNGVCNGLDGCVQPFLVQTAFFWWTDHSTQRLALFQVLFHSLVLAGVVFWRFNEQWRAFDWKCCCEIDGNNYAQHSVLEKVLSKARMHF